MKKLILAGCISTLIACSNTNDFDAGLDSKVSQPATTTQPAATQPATTVPNLPVINPAATTVNTQPVVTSSPVTTTTTPTTAAGMNPPHGQPGHRCDLSVGAPLNSAPKQTTATTTTTTPTPQNIVVKPSTTTTTTTTPAKTAPGMNPAHGQPGHRCDISVGAPLNSAPSTTTTTTPVKEEAKKPAAAEPWKMEMKPAKTDSSKN